MESHDLNPLFSPRDIAVYGAEDTPAGKRVLKNLLAGNFVGTVYPISPTEQNKDHPSYASLDDTAGNIDLAIIASSARTVPGILDDCGEHGVKAAIVLNSGFKGVQAASLRIALVEAARRNRVRVLGPGCLGAIRPPIGLNASSSHGMALTGDVALISQSNALCTAVLDWAEPNRVGFSAVVSLGDAAELDFGDILDYLAMDPVTRSILLYVETVRNARRFLSGLRAATRVKPVIVAKPRRYKSTSSGMSDTLYSDEVFDAALARAGAVRVLSIGKLLAITQLLAAGARASGDRMAIVSNGQGPAMMTVDAVLDQNLRISELSTEALDQLSQSQTQDGKQANPINIPSEAQPSLYQEAVKACLTDPNVDGVLALFSPLAGSRPTNAAQEVIEAAGYGDEKSRRSGKPVLTCWMGHAQVEQARQLLFKHGLPHFVSPERAVEAFSSLAHYHLNQQLLLQTPGPLSYETLPDVEGARLIIEGILSEGRKVLDSVEAKAVLVAFHIPIAQAVEANTSNHALVAAETLGFPVAIKINSPDISHKSDVNGVRLDVSSPQAVRRTFNELVDEARALLPDAQINGVTVERMYRSSSERELMIGVARDPVFGPVVSFGYGGSAVDVVRVRAVALPPLNEFIIEDLIRRTRVEGLLGQFRQMPPVRRSALVEVLQRVSEMVCELPEIVAMTINPLIADHRGVIAVDAHFTVAYHNASADRYSHMAIYPYPAHLSTSYQMADGTDVAIQPIRPEDADKVTDFFHNLSPESKYFRFMQTIKTLTPEMLVRFTQIDYDREMALVATCKQGDQEIQIAIAHYAIQPGGTTCNFALAIADKWRSKGLGMRLMHALMQIATGRGLNTIEGEVLAKNVKMLGLMKRLGFTIRQDPEDQTIRLVSRSLSV